MIRLEFKPSTVWLCCLKNLLFSPKNHGSFHARLTPNTLLAFLSPQSTYINIFCASESSSNSILSTKSSLRTLSTLFWSLVDFISHAIRQTTRRVSLERNLGIDCTCPSFKDEKTESLCLWIQLSTFSSNCLHC